MNKNNLLQSQRLAVIGSGISGTACAWLLRQHHDVQLFESEQRFGGHTHSVEVQEGERSFAIDTGFMVYNRENYPLLVRLFEHLGVPSYPTSMSFSVSLKAGELEYAGTNLATLFAQPSNLFRARHWRMLSDIVRFNRLTQALNKDPLAGSEALGSWLQRERFSETFKHHYLYPMAAAIWSCPSQSVAEFPLRRFVQFFQNHGLNRLMDRPQWFTVEGGSSTYMRRLIDDLGVAAQANSAVVGVHAEHKGYRLVFADGRQKSFDQVVFACHSDQALALLPEADPQQKQLLQAVPYQSNRVYLHTDKALMPKRRSAWASWNYLGDKHPANEHVSVSYWMNSLQRLPSEKDYFVSLNPLEAPADECVIKELQYHHPLFDQRSALLNQQLKTVQGRQNLWFCGAWTGYGFHEDGLRSAVEVALALGAEIEWLGPLDASRRLMDTGAAAFRPEFA